MFVLLPVPWRYPPCDLALVMLGLLRRARRTGMEAATMQTAPSAIPRMLRGGVLTGENYCVSRVRSDRNLFVTLHLLRSLLVMARMVMTLTIEVRPALVADSR